MKRGEIWLINLDPSVGAEIRKTRPAVIVSCDSVGILPLKAVVPLMDWKERYAIAPWLIAIAPSARNGLDNKSAADPFQIRSLAQERFVQRVGQMEDPQMAKIAQALALVLEI